MGPDPQGAARPRRPLSLARAHVRTCHHFPHAGGSSLRCVVAGRSACARTVVEGSEFCVHRDRLLGEHRADALKQSLPRRKQARGRWQPTIIAMGANESALSSEGSASSARRSADPSTVRPRRAEAAAESVEDIRRTLLDAATSASKPAWVEVECTERTHPPR